ncbi:hypothetical protein HK104_009812 [Borealophlyctis nickersoniae]|nr:hypothetical protein HK104_009812 [Borealophlyctis nickersoniae]
MQFKSLLIATLALLPLASTQSTNGTECGFATAVTESAAQSCVQTTLSAGLSDDRPLTQSIANTYILDMVKCLCGVMTKETSAVETLLTRCGAPEKDVQETRTQIQWCKDGKFAEVAMASNPPLTITKNGQKFTFKPDSGSNGAASISAMSMTAVMGAIAAVGAFVL